jgi:hypothetical protein
MPRRSGKIPNRPGDVPGRSKRNRGLSPPHKG